MYDLNRASWSHFKLILATLCQRLVSFWRGSL